MRITRISVFAAATFATLAALSYAQVSVTPVTSLKEAQADYAAGKYQECLKKIASLLPLASSTPADKATLFSVRGECLLHEKQSQPAADAFASASTTYASLKDFNNAATMHATSDLIKASESYQYVPKTGKDRTGIDIIDSTKRTAAMNAYFKDQLSSIQDQVKVLEANLSLQGIVDFAPKLTDLAKLELAATSDDKQATAMQKTLASDAKSAVNKFITSSTSKADSIAQQAATLKPQPLPPGVKVPRNYKPTMIERGLTDADKSTLQDIESNVDKLTSMTRGVTIALKVDGDYFKTELASATKLKAHINNIQAGKFK